MARIAGRALVATALFTAWACAKATDSDLGGSTVDSQAGKSASGGTGGSSARGGTGGSSASSTGGTSAGKGGTGTGGSSTGGSSTGGSSTGGSGNGSGKGGSGGSTGGSSNGGNAGDDGVPPDVLARAKVVLRYIARNPTKSDAVETKLYFENKSDDDLDLSQVKVRYWTTLEGSWGNLACYYATPEMLSAQNVTLKYVDDGDDSHVLIGFKDGAVPAHNASPFAKTEFQMKVDAQGGGQFVQDNDWSFDASAIADNPPEPNDKITVYLADKLIWGCEPSGTCAGEGGAGGQGGQGGQGGEAGQTATGGTGQGGQGGEPTSGQGGA